MSKKNNFSGKWVLVFGDQLDATATVWDTFDKHHDAVWMAEASGEATHVWSSKPRIAFFLSAMRHFRDALRARGFTVHYRELNPGGCGDIFDYLKADIKQHRPSAITFTRPGEWRILTALETLLDTYKVPYEMHEDSHFFTTPKDFAHFAIGRKQLRMEYFYRDLRKKFNILVTPKGQPEGGKWNFDSENRRAFDKNGPLDLSVGPNYKVDTITQSVISLVQTVFYDHPGSLESFGWPVTPAAAEALLDDFIPNYALEN
jgi:deoxyribodipyrimidine photolyase-related protein